MLIVDVCVCLSYAVGSTCLFVNIAFKTFSQHLIIGISVVQSQHIAHLIND